MNELSVCLFSKDYSYYVELKNGFIFKQLDTGKLLVCGVDEGVPITNRIREIHDDEISIALNLGLNINKLNI